MKVDKLSNAPFKINSAVESLDASSSLTFDKQKIDEENQMILKSMSEAEILEEQQKLMSNLGNFVFY